MPAFMAVPVMVCYCESRKIQANEMKRKLYTIGYSPFLEAEFIDVLKRHDITAVCDVRSAPYSRYKPGFNKEVLAQRLFRNDIAYCFFGRELGGRPTDSGLYDGQRICYDRLVAGDLFRQGLVRLKELAHSHTTALMCAEKDPVTCHRGIVICRQIRDEFEIAHILEDDSLESHADTERRLVKLLKIPTDDLFRTVEELIEDAYNLQAKKIGLVKRKR